MKLAKLNTADGRRGVGVVEGESVLLLPPENSRRALSDLLETADPTAEVRRLSERATERLPLSAVTLLAPIDEQEVWAAGVTYRRSQVARMEESQGAASFYDLVYAADRPELFFKASPHRVSGPGEPLRIRTDATWNVPEPELALVLNSRLQIVGYTIGNDMSSRDIEGENPLYLPQAKVYDQCCGLGPWITLAEAMPPVERIGIRLAVRRGGIEAFSGSTSVANMARTFTDLVSWLGRDNSFPRGAFLLTGTGVVPSSDFTLHAGDEVEIAIDGIGSLVNSIVQG